jgi:uncharacterized protein Yka (UPF0111/DUF47 family)
MKRWFLPREPDILGLLRAQAAVTTATMRALSAWTHGETGQAQAVRDGEHEADDAKRALQAELRSAFSTPLDPEDVYELSERLDEILAVAKDLVREAEVLAVGPDAALAAMTSCIVEGVQQLEVAFEALPDRIDEATAAADAAKRAARRLEHSYRAGMLALLEVHEIGEQLGRRELYRRASHLAEAVIRVAERVWYAVVKQT